MLILGVVCWFVGVGSLVCWFVGLLACWLLGWWFVSLLAWLVVRLSFLVGVPRNTLKRGC